MLESNGLSSRSRQLFGNVIGSSFYKGINIIVGFLLVRYAIEFSDEETYGIWLTLSSFFTWFSAVEVGIGNSLRSRITTLFTSSKFQEIRALLVKGYKALLITYGIVVTALIIPPLFWDIEIFFVPRGAHYENFGFIFQLCLALYMLHYVFAFLNMLLLSVHKARTTFLIAAVQNTVLLVGVLIFLESDVTPSLALLCIWFSAVPAFVLGLANIVAFRSILKKMRPSFSEIVFTKPERFKEMNYGFLIIQVCTLVIYATDHIIISNFISGTEVTKYAVTFKYFNVITVVFNLVLVPYWASFAEAMQMNDRKWITKNIRFLSLLIGALSILGVIMVFFSNSVYSLWIGKDLSIPILLSALMCVSVLLTAWYNIFVYYLSSINQITWQMRLIIIGAIINVPLSLLFIQKMGSSGVILATSISLLPMAIALPIQSFSLLKSDADK
ncbi:MAG: lipopolysaccharide biosynthesis protein [Crocinitomicaceae bacterium]